MKSSKIIEIHLDLDGLFADFNSRVKHLCGSEPKDVEKKMLWKIIHRDKNFFANLEVMEGSMKLWDALKEHHTIKFLTGAPSSEAFREQKRAWVAQVFGPQYEVNVVPRKDKPLWSGPYKVLIDDTEKNIDEWIAKGGHGIFHVGHDYDRTIAQLYEYDAAIL